MFVYVFCVLLLLNVFTKDIGTTAMLRCEDNKDYDCASAKSKGYCENDEKLEEMGLNCPVTCEYCEPEPEENED